MKWAAIIMASIGAVGCATISSIEPTTVPPAHMHHVPITATVEMVHPAAVALRCLQRRTRTIARACGGAGWMVVPHPCTWPSSGDSYARMMCHEAGHALDPSIRHRGYNYGPLSAAQPIAEPAPVQEIAP